jgi:uncharacterized protein (DUF305 family)
MGRAFTRRWSRIAGLWRSGRQPGWRRSAAIAAVLVLAAATVALAAAAIARSAPDDAAAQRPGRPSSSAPAPALVIVPGRPGESAAAIPADQVSAPAVTAYNALDAWYVRAMIMHHGQAVEMATLAPSRARNPQIRAIAERVAVGQNAEIAPMRAWLQARGLDDRLGDHQHGAMRGMQSPAALRTLAAASGDRFDRIFVDLMSDHHQGAVDMATDVLKGGQDAEVERLATAVVAEQTVEIARMREVLGS